MNFMYGDGNNELTQKEQASHVSRFKNRLLILLSFSFLGLYFYMKLYAWELSLNLSFRFLVTQKLQVVNYSCSVARQDWQWYQELLEHQTQEETHRHSQSTISNKNSPSCCFKLLISFSNIFIVVVVIITITITNNIIQLQRHQRLLHHHSQIFHGPWTQFIIFKQSVIEQQFLHHCSASSKRKNFHVWRRSS